MITSRKLIRSSLVSAAIAPLALGLLVGASPAFAQVVPDIAQQPTTSAVPTNADASTTPPSEGIIVTGSRIQRTDLSSAAPLAVTTQQEFKLRGSPNVETVLNSLPQVVPGTTAFSNNPGGGVSTLNLRNLGAQRTLVLVNGRRWMFYDTSQVVDLNTIPTFLIGSVDTVTGGASAVYGSDAIAGVVNFKLRTDLKGIEVGTQYGLTGQGDGERWDSHIALGGEFADGRGHVTTYAEYYKRKAIFAAARSFSQTTLTDDGNGGFTAGGSSTSGAGRFRGTGTSGVGTNYTGLGATFDTAGGPSRPFTTADYYNYAPTNYLMVPQERWLLGGYGDYEINDHVTAYTEISYVNNRVVNALAPTPVTGTFSYNLAASQQFLSAADFATLQTIAANEGTLAGGTVNLSTNRRIVETGLRISDDERNAFRVLAGLKGDITDRLHYDAYYMFSRTRDSNVEQGNISQRAFQAGLLDGSLDIFGPNTISPAALTAITITSQNQSVSQLQVESASVNGELFNLGMGGSDIGFAAGVEHRQVSSSFLPDTALSSGDVIGFNAGLPTSGGYGVTEGFAEVSVPIVADKPFFHLLELHGAARYSSYSLGGVGNVWTYAGDVKWSPVEDILLRGQYQRAIRAPNVGELFGGTSQGFPAVTDPCGSSAASISDATRALCIATGVPAANVGTDVVQPNVQVVGAFGGNANLQAEVSTSYTFGGVLSPHFIPRFHISADYFNIKVKNAVGYFGGGANNTLALCYGPGGSATSVYCQAIRRNTDTGEIDGSTNADGTQNVISVYNANVASIKTSGIDVAADYTQPLNFGLMGETSKINASFAGTWTKKNSTTPAPGLATIQCAGKFGLTCGEPQGHYKWTTRLSYLDGPMTISGAWRHLSRVRDDDPTTDYTTETIKAFNYFDLAVSSDIGDNLSLTAGVNNFLNKQPPLLGDNQQQTNTYPSTYDVLGRDFFVSASLKF